MDQRTLDTLAIKEVVENWAVWRDSGDWERFRTVWHDEGVMMATWFQGTFEEFIRVNQEGWKRGVSILHLLGGTSVEIAGNRLAFLGRFAQSPLRCGRFRHDSPVCARKSVGIVTNNGGCRTSGGTQRA